MCKYWRSVKVENPVQAVTNVVDPDKTPTVASTMSMVHNQTTLKVIVAVQTE